MSLYLGNSEKLKIYLDGVLYSLNLFSSTPIINGIMLRSSDNYILKDSHGLYLTVPYTPENLFNKNDADVHLTGRFNSSHLTVNYAEGQLVTGYIEANMGDTFIVQSDKPYNATTYTSAAIVYNGNKEYLREVPQTSTYWIRSDDGLTNTLTIEPMYWDTDMSGAAWIRFCVAYTDIDSIIIAKS